MSRVVRVGRQDWRSGRAEIRGCFRSLFGDGSRCLQRHEQFGEADKVEVNGKSNWQQCDWSRTMGGEGEMA